MSGRAISSFLMSSPGWLSPGRIDHDFARLECKFLAATRSLEAEPRLPPRRLELLRRDEPLLAPHRTRGLRRARLYLRAPCSEALPPTPLCVGPLLRSLASHRFLY